MLRLGLCSRWIRNGWIYCKYSISRRKFTLSCDEVLTLSSFGILNAVHNPDIPMAMIDLLRIVTNRDVLLRCIAIAGC